MSADRHAEKQGAPLRSSFALGAIILALIGLGISIYSTKHHLAVKASGATDAFCNINATFNCDDVAKSSYAEILNIPLGVWGGGFFLGLIILMGFGLWKPRYAREVAQTYSAFVIIGILASIVLGAISALQIGALCLTCIGVYGINLLQGAWLFLNKKDVDTQNFWQGISNGSSYVVIGIALAVGSYQLFKPAPKDFKEDKPQTDIATVRHDSEMSNLAPARFEFKIDRSAFSGMGEDYRSGSDEAKVVIVEFADFECPACRMAFEQVRQMKKEFGDSIQVVFKNYPLDNACNAGIPRKMHENACTAAILTRCAGAIGKFWDLHDKIFDRQKDISASNLVSWAREVGLTDSQIKECQASNDILNKIKDDINVGNQAGVDSTPTIFINGQKFVGQRSGETLRAEIQKLLSR